MSSHFANSQWSKSVESWNETVKVLYVVRNPKDCDPDVNLPDATIQVPWLADCNSSVFSYIVFDSFYVCVGCVEWVLRSVRDCPCCHSFPYSCATKDAMISLRQGSSIPYSKILCPIQCIHRHKSWTTITYHNMWGLGPHKVYHVKATFLLIALPRFKR